MNTTNYPHPSLISLKNWPQKLMNMHNQNRHSEGLRRELKLFSWISTSKPGRIKLSRINLQTLKKLLHIIKMSQNINETLVKSELKLAETASADTGIQNARIQELEGTLTRENKIISL